MVSIHAPTRGATLYPYALYIPILCFNPRTYKRCDRSNRNSRRKNRSFNPRTYKRCDYANEDLQNVYIVSIHAPTRGATFWVFGCQNTEQGFNPRTYKRCDISRFGSITLFTSFNPRTYKRCDQTEPQSHLLLLRFNPRTYKRCDYFRFF